MNGWRPNKVGKLLLVARLALRRVQLAHDERPNGTTNLLLILLSSLSLTRRTRTRQKRRLTRLYHREMEEWNSSRPNKKKKKEKESSKETETENRCVG